MSDSLSQNLLTSLYFNSQNKFFHLSRNNQTGPSQSSSYTPLVPTHVSQSQVPARSQPHVPVMPQSQIAYESQSPNQLESNPSLSILISNPNSNHMLIRGKTGMLKPKVFIADFISESLPLEPQKLVKAMSKSEWKYAMQF